MATAGAEKELNPWESQGALFDEAARHLRLPAGLSRAQSREARDLHFF